MNSTCILALSLLPGIGRKSIYKILQNKPDGISSINELVEILPQKYSGTDITTAIEKADLILTQSLKLDIHSITPFDPIFPACLKSINNPPFLLFYKGNISLLETPKRVAIVGTRNPSLFGIKKGRSITKWFVERGYIIVSGLAKGCDTIAHQTCIQNGGKTIAWLPSGIDHIYPRENQKLADRIVETGGLLISEYPITSTSKKNFFIERDRLQSGSSMGVLIIETEVDGGTMLTAGFALTQKRPLACVDYDHGLDIPHNRGNIRLINSRQAFGLKSDNLLVFDRILGNS